jgi:hypothetical protein
LIIPVVVVVPGSVPVFSAVETVTRDDGDRTTDDGGKSQSDDLLAH